MSATRRQVLARSGALGVGIAFTGALSELFAGTAAAQALGHTGYGPLVPDPKGLLDLPKGSATRSSPARATSSAPVRARSPPTTTA